MKNCSVDIDIVGIGHQKVATIGLETHLDGSGSSWCAGCTKNQLRRPHLGPFRELLQKVAKVGLETPPDRSGSSCCAGCTKNQLVRAHIGLFRELLASEQSLTDHPGREERKAASR